MHIISCLVGAFGILLWSFWRFNRLTARAWDFNFTRKTESTRKRQIQDINALVDFHQTAAALADLIHYDGAGSWPPKANHEHSAWPRALQAYKEIYLELAPLLPKMKPSLDDDTNREDIANFRSRFRQLLRDRVDLAKVKHLLEAAEAGRSDVFPRDMYNAFYCCIASSRHAYRWATIPVVKVAQLERTVDFPAELDEPWAYLQRQYGCSSPSGNNTSNLVLNFDVHGQHVFRINTGMPDLVTSSEEAFARIFYNVELLVGPKIFPFIYFQYSLMLI